MDILDLHRLLPHGPPILMLDRVVDIEPGVGGIGMRLFRPGDPCFDGHFPGRPILPGVLTIEALAQTTMVVMLAAHLEALDQSGAEIPLGYLARVKEMSFQRPIEPDQEIAFEVLIERRIGQFTIVGGRVTHDGELCAKGSLAVALDQEQLAAALGG